ncbi:MAG: hypothetical protein IKO99_12195 [Bacteroidales bacterium]|nr:hypothetical protein [Bacteroidales bacterium]
MDKKNTYPRTTRHTLLDTTINANSVQELNEKLVAFDLTDEADVTIKAHIYGINREVITEAEYQKDCEDASRQNTIRLLRRQVRHLKSLLKSKDRAMFAQEEFYKCMLDECQKREDAANRNIEEWFSNMVKKTVEKTKHNGNN